MRIQEARAHAYLSGTVQGVGMRAHVHFLAKRFSLVGFVRNLRDGKVEVVAEGSKEAIEKLFHSVRTGSYSIYVKDIEISWEDPANKFVDFEIAY